MGDATAIWGNTLPLDPVLTNAAIFSLCAEIKFSQMENISLKNY